MNMATNGTTKQPVVRRTPAFPAFGDIGDIFSLLDRRWPFPAFRHSLGHEALPAIDMFEREGNVVVKAEMPGIEPDKIDVSVSGNELRISGERREEKEIKEEDYFHAERSYGHIYRSITLPEGCDATAIAATAKDGVIEVVVPKKAAATTKRVEVKRG